MNQAAWLQAGTGGQTPESYPALLKVFKQSILALPQTLKTTRCLQVLNLLRVLGMSCFLLASLPQAVKPQVSCALSQLPLIRLLSIFHSLVAIHHLL